MPARQLSKYLHHKQLQKEKKTRTENIEIEL